MSSNFKFGFIFSVLFTSGKLISNCSVSSKVFRKLFESGSRKEVIKLVRSTV